MKLNTKVIHAGNTIDEATGSVNVPIYQTSTYRLEQYGINKGFEYARSDNPTREALQRLISELEEGDEGFAFASGMAAITTVFAQFKSGDCILVSENLYGGTFRLLSKVFLHYGIEYIPVDTTDAAKVEDAITGKVVAVYVESPTNPLLLISDLEAIARITKKHKIQFIVDNTFMSPYLQKPLILGADIVIHSATKYLGGHSDLLAGLVVTKGDYLGERIAFLQNAIGAILGPQDAFLLIRGIKTLSVRLDRHIENTENIVQYLSRQKKVKKVYHPSLTDHPNRDIFLKQSKGSVAVVSFELEEGICVETFLSSFHLIALAGSLGGVESLISHPLNTSHAEYSEAERKQIGISDQLIRLSVGIEDIEDLIADLEYSFSQV